MYKRQVSFLSKVVERVGADQLQALLDETNALDPFQLGFRLCHCMKMALVILFDDLLREAKRGKMSLLVLLDISATFDTINHGILLGRLSELGIGSLVLARRPVPRENSLGIVHRLRGILIVGFCKAQLSPQCCLIST